MRPFVEQYLSGRTPIACTNCNTDVKFEPLLRMARQIGAERLATGHYARIRKNDETGRWELLRARDDSKDQSYFLWGLTQEQLARSEFPLGELTKEEVRGGGAPRESSGRRKAREHGALLRAQRQLRAVHRGVFARTRRSVVEHRRRDRQRRRQRSSAATTACTISRSASARDWDLPQASRTTCWRSIAKTIAWSLATTSRCARPPAKSSR